MNIRRSGLFVLVILSLTAFAQSVSLACITDPYLDQITSWKDVSPYTADDPLTVLGPPACRGGFAIGPGDELIAAFTDNYVFDGPGNDLYLWEYKNAKDPETVDVWASMDNARYVFLGSAGSKEVYDLGNYHDLNIVRYLKFIGTPTDGLSTGYDLQGVIALNSSPVPIPGAAFLLGTGLLGVLGLKRRMPGKK